MQNLSGISTGKPFMQQNRRRSGHAGPREGWEEGGELNR